MLVFIFFVNQIKAISNFLLEDLKVLDEFFRSRSQFLH